MARQRNPLGLMEDPIKSIVIDAVTSLDKNYTIKSVDVIRDVEELRIVVILRPRREGSTISTWRIIDLEERIATILGIEVELTHSRVGVTPEGYLMIIYSLKSKDIKPLLREQE